MDSTASTTPVSEDSLEDDTLVDDSVSINRELLRELLNEEGVVGDSRYVLSKDYIDRFLTMPTSSWLDLLEALGPIDFGLIADEHGLLYPSSCVCNISTKAFDILSGWLGIKGLPIERSLMLNAQSGALEIEQFPPFIFVHVVGNPRKHQPTYSYTRYGSNARSSNTPAKENPPFVRISAMKTFADLLQQVSKTAPLKKVKCNGFRAWLINSANIDELQTTISASQFTFEISEKQVLLPSILESTLLSQGLGASAEKFHLLVDPKDSSNEFAIDSYISGLDVDAYMPKLNFGLSGHLGLSNLGNTCYMNSALQCLLHVPELNNYFFFNVYQKELNLDNPLGCHGNIANSFGNLLKQAFDPNPTGTCVTPREFKSLIGRYSSMFSGYMQQDSQEFLSWLLDSIHEDLNRIHVKPYSEKPELQDDDDPTDPNVLARLAAKCWDQHKLRNDSVIVDLFTGMYQSTLVCPTCHKTSVTFDPFSDMTLLLPIDKKWYHTFTIVDCSSEPRIMRLEVELNKTCNFDDLVAYLARFLHINARDLFLYEWFNSCFIRDYQSQHDHSRLMPIGDLIRSSDTIIVYHVPHNPILDIIVPVYNLMGDKLAQTFGLPIFVVLPKQDEYPVKLISDKIERLSRIHAKGRSVKPIHIEEVCSTENPENINADPIHNGDACVDEASTTKEPALHFSLKYCPLQSPPKYRSYSAREEDTPQTITVPLRPLNFGDFEILLDGSHSQSFKDQSVEGDNSGDNSSADISEEIQVALEPAPPPYSLPLLGALDDDIVSESEPFQSDLLSDANCPDPLLPPRAGRNSQSDNTTSSASPLSSGPPNELSSSSSIASSTGVAKTSRETVKLTNTSILLCQWDRQSDDEMSDVTEISEWLKAPLVPNPELERNKARFERQRGRKISLHDCLKSFNTPEVLGEHDLWYCPRCKDHKQATKTIQLQKVGDILTIHLKRFHSARAFSDKIDVIVDFPITDLDMTPYLSATNTESSEHIYDLIAVDNHYGGLGGGHYTASVKNFRDGKWYYFDDSRATLMKDPAECVTGAAYLLFYRKRTPISATEVDASLGGPKLSKMLVAGRAEYFESLQVKVKQVENVMEMIAAFERDSPSEVVVASAMDPTKVGDLVAQSAEDIVKRQFETIDDDGGPENSKPASFGFDNDVDIDYDSDNTRKQRLLSKQSDFNKLLHIRSSGKQDLSSSPLGDTIYDSDADQNTR